MRRLTILIIAVLGQGCGDFDLPHRSNGSKAPSVIPGQDDTRKIVVNGGEEPDPGTAQDGGGGAPPPPTDGGVGPAPTTPDSKPAPTPKQDSGGGSTGVCGNAFESEVFTLVNQERQKAGKQPFKCDALAGKAARDYSQVMCDKNHFSHTGPDGSSPFDRMEKAGISFQTAGENIAAGQATPAEVMQSWMTSAGHRANILGNYAYIGIGYVPCSNGGGGGWFGGGGFGHYWTQDFWK